MPRKTGVSTGVGRGLDAGSRLGWFKPGHPGSGGRPKKEVSEAAFTVLTEVITPDVWRRIVEQWKLRALRGDLKAIEALANRLIGAVSTPEDDELKESTREFLKEFYTSVLGHQAKSLDPDRLQPDSGSTGGA
jgi:hypothetical protein